MVERRPRPVAAGTRHGLAAALSLSLLVGAALTVAEPPAAAATSFAAQEAPVFHGVDPTGLVAATGYPPDSVGKILAFARAQLGKPYVWGGTGPHGFDCSGLIQQAFRVAKVHLPRGSIAQARVGKHVRRRDLAVGDLVFSHHRGHVQLYIGGGRVIEAARPGTRVRIGGMLPAWMINAYTRIPLSQ